MNFKLINFCEIDKFASDSYCAIHDVDKSLNLGDVTVVKTEDVGDFDLLVGGSPCQDFSSAGKQAGAMYSCKDCGHKYNPLEQHFSKRNQCPNCNSANIEITRSSLVVHYLRFLHDKKPKFAIYENVKNLQNKSFRSTFDLFLKEVEDYGYNVFWQVLNAKDYGIPQNRERIIAIFIRKDICKGDFMFPEKLENRMRIKDILQENVEEQYYLPKQRSDTLIKKLIINDKLIENYETDDEKTIFKMINLFDVLDKEYQVRRVYVENKSGDDLPICVASRGRNPENPGLRVAGLPTEQRLEINTNDTTNTLTSVQKDNYILEKDLPAIMKNERTEYGKTIRKDYESGKIKEKLGNMRDLTVREDGISNTLTTVQKDNYLLEYKEKKPIDKTWLFKKYKKFYDTYGYIPEFFTPWTCKEIKEVLPTQTTLCGSMTNISGVCILDKEQRKVVKEICEDLQIAYRIRRLTPRECFRLMGFNDKLYEKARYYTEEEKSELKKYNTEIDLNGNERAIRVSSSQLYRQAGNSIVVDMLYYIFKKLSEEYQENFENISVCSLFSGIGAFEIALSAVGDESSLVSKQFHSENFTTPPMN